MLIPIQIGTGKQVVKKKKVSTVTPEEQAKAFDILRKQTSKDIAYEEKKQAELEANLRKRTVDPATNIMMYGDVEEGVPTAIPTPQAPKVAPTPKVTKEGLVKKTITTKFGDIDYTATPEESQIFRSGDINAINNLMREIALDFEKGGEEQGLKPKTTTTEKYTFDTVDAGLQDNFVAKKTKEILNQTFKALMPAPMRAISDIAESAGQGLQKKGQELMQSDSSLGKIGGFLTTAAGGILEDASNPLATFTAGTGNLYDPTATMEERVGAGFNVVGYALGAMNPLEAAGAGIKAFRAGATGTEALTTAGRSLLRSSVPFGTKIDTALATKAANKASLKNLIDVLEAEGQLMGKTRAALTKEFVDAGKTFAKETGKTAEEFYTKYLNDFAEGKGQLTTPSPTAPAAFELPSVKAPEGVPEAPVFNWADETAVSQLRDDLKTSMKQKFPNATDEQIGTVAEQLLEKKRGQKNPYLATNEKGETFDWRQPEPEPTAIPEPTAPVVEPPTSVIPEPTAPAPTVVPASAVEPPTSVIPEPTVTPAVEPTPTIEPPTTEPIPPVEPTSIKNEAMARDLKEMGFDDLPETQKQTFNEFLNEAEQRGLTQQTALDNILKDFEDGKVRQLDKAETLAMAKHAAELKNRIRDLRVRFRENPTGALADEIATAQERFNTVAGAVKRAGAEQAKALVARKAFLDKDYDVTSVLSEAAEARMAGKTSAQIRAEAERIAKRTGESVDEILKNGLHSKKEIEILTKRAEEAEKAAAEANAAKDALKKDLEDGLLAQQRAAKRTARTKENAKARAEVAKKDFLALAGKATAGLDPTLLKPLAQFIKAKIDEGVIILKGEGAIDQVVDILRKEGIDVDAVDVADALQFDRLNNRRPLSDLQKEKQRLLADLRAEAKKISPDSAEQMAKDEATKQRIRDRIAALDEQIKSGNYLEKVPREVRQRDEEIVRLKAIEKLKKKKVDQELAKLAPKTGVAKVTNAIRSSKLAVFASRISDVAGNATAGVSKIVEVPVKYAVDKLTSTVLNELPINRVSSDNLGRMNNSFRRAALKMGYEWRGDIGELGGKTLGEKASNFLQNFGSVLSGVGDTPFKSLYFEIGADFGADLKARKLLGKGASELDVATLREDILRNIDEHPDVEISATNFALQQTFNNDNVVSKIGGDVKRGAKQRFGLDKGTAAADAVDFALDELAFQFSKVITNVGAQAFDYVVPGGGIARGSLNLALAKAAKKAGKDIPWEQRDAINQMFARGLTSLAVGTAVTAIAPKLLPNRIVGEKGKEYIDFGDWQRLGGLSLPILVAIADSQLETYRNEDDEPLTPERKSDIKTKFLIDLALSNPLATNFKDILDVIDSDRNIKQRFLQFVAKKSSNVLIPGQFRDYAKRQEATGPMGMMTGQEKIRSKFKVWDPEEGKRGGVKSSDDWRVIFGDEFKSKIPRTIFNPNFNRQTLPLKGQEEEALRP
jgi:hypothetical protein